jgi:DNA-binding MarR family transcriptional regulator
MGVERVDSSFLETLVGYNARRAAVHIIEDFLRRMAAFDLRPVDFSVMSLIVHNPGITSRQLCSTLGILPPNLVGMVGALEKRGLIRRERHREDGRAMSLYATDAGTAMMQQAEKVAAELEIDRTRALTARERRTLMRLLQKIYL